MNVTADAVTYRPLLAISIARVAAYWSEVELAWSIAYTYLLYVPDGMRHQKEFSAYYNTRDWQKRRDKLIGAVNASGLPSDILQDAYDLYAEFEGLAWRRNHVVHGHWAWSPQYLESLFLAQARSVGVQINAIFTMLRRIAEKPQRYPQQSVDLNQGSYQEYRREDFEDLVKDLQVFHGKVMAYSNRILPHAVAAVARTLKLNPGNKLGSTLSDHFLRKSGNKK